MEQQLTELRRDLPTADRALIDEFLDLAAAENRTGKITLGRRVNETRALIALRAELGEDAWRYGMEAACRGAAPNCNYVKKAARSWDGRPAGASRRGRGGPLPAERFDDIVLDEWGQPVYDGDGQLVKKAE